MGTAFIVVVSFAAGFAVAIEILLAAGLLRKVD